MNVNVIPKSDLNRIDKMKDEEIDYSDIPPLTDEQLIAMKPLSEVLPESITVHLDSDVVHWFRLQAEEIGDGDYQLLINEALREHIARRKEPV